MADCHDNHLPTLVARPFLAQCDCIRAWGTPVCLSDSDTQAHKPPGVLLLLGQTVQPVCQAITQGLSRLNPASCCVQVMLQDGSVQPLSPALRAKATQTINQMALKALRCLAFAQKTDLGMLPAPAQTMQRGPDLTLVAICSHL